MCKKERKRQKALARKLLDEPMQEEIVGQADSLPRIEELPDAMLVDAPPESPESTNFRPTSVEELFARVEAAVPRAGPTAKRTTRTLLDELSSRRLSESVNCSVLETLCVYMAFSYKRGISKTEDDRKMLLDILHGFLPDAGLPSFSAVEKVRTGETSDACPQRLIRRYCFLVVVFARHDMDESYILFGVPSNL